MEFTREIYWNVGHVVLIPMYLIALGSIAFSIHKLWQRRIVYLKGKPVNRFDNLSERVWYAIKTAIGQVRVLTDKEMGLVHLLLFFGFLLLTIGTTLVFIQADMLDPIFGIRFLKGGFYKIFSLVMDLAGLIMFLALLIFTIRRFIIKPSGLETTKDDVIMHLLLYIIIITGFIVEGFRMAATEINRPEMMIFSPVGMVFAKIFAGLDNIETIHKAFWWIHLFAVAGFFVSIGLTKFKHILLIPTNYLVHNTLPKGTIDTLNFENEDATYGVKSVSDFTWKDIFDTDACVKCKRCQDRCPAYASEKPLSPMKFIADVGDSAFTGTELENVISKETLWSCTTCGNCQEVCPAEIEHVNKIINMRRNLVLMEGEFPGDEVMLAVNNIETNGNPFGFAFATRADWAKELGVGLFSDGGEYDILYFVGCYASFDKRNIAIAKSFVEICKLANVRVGILGKEEKCCGEPVRKLGNEYLYQTIANENIEVFKKYKISRIVTTCPHCFNTLGRDYKELGLDVPVVHHTQFISELINSGKIRLNSGKMLVTYHDSCYMGRYMGIYDEPRDIIRSMGIEINEMDRNRENSFCCGGGGGRIFVDEKGTKISALRVEMANKTGVDTIVANCPFCTTMFEDGLKVTSLDSSIKVKDLAEIVLERIIK
ncbi:MAG: 4Fe-4S dicluster domain-containing protein [Deferribacterales bacterium]